jgi:hypothetical protein
MGRKVRRSKGQSAPSGWDTIRRVTTSLLLALVAAAGTACADDGGRRQSDPVGQGEEEEDEEGNEATALDEGPSAACVDGATRTCTVKLGEHNGVVSCFRGEQVCMEGTWGPCEDADEPGL